jgi:glutathione S-transferase
MILLGQYDSPFVRRVGIAMVLYGLAFEHKPWSTFGDADKIRPHNPLTRVPTLVLADGDALLDSHAIIDYLDGLMPADRRLFPVAEPARHRAMAIASLGCGIADKSVSMFYEKRLHREVSDVWINRCRTQIGAGLATLEADRVSRPGLYWFGDRIGHADIAVAAALRFLGEAHPGLIDMAAYPAVAAHAAHCETLPAFVTIAQRFIPPA